MSTKHILLRFYEELNDFLTEDKRKITFEFPLVGTPSVKDVIESLGVPHTEVDLILVNGESKSFDYLVQAKDRISVFPVFETLDIASVTAVRKTPLREPKFILDVHLGKLTHHLRMLGFDCSYRNNYTDQEIVKQSVAEKRIILTRDIGLLKHKVITHGYWLRSQNSERQLIEVCQRFDLQSKIKAFSRCLECNDLLQEVPKESVLTLLPPKTKQYFHQFYQCQGCKKVYWRGSHYDRMLALLTSFSPLQADPPSH